MELDVADLLRQNQVLTVFLTLGLGFIIGRIRIGGVVVGSTVGVLLTGLVLGHYELVAAEHWGTLGFYIFMYSVGMSAGPRFFGVLKGSTMKYIALAATTSGFAFALTLFIAELDFEPGISAGMMAGALTSTPTLVAAQDAVQSGAAALPDGMSERRTLENITVGYAITYLFGTTGLIGFIMIMPKIFRIDLHKESLVVSKQLGLGTNVAHKKSELPVAQAYEVAFDEFVGRSLKELDLARKKRLFIVRIKRDGEVVEPEPSTTLHVGDKVEVVAPYDVHQLLHETLGPRIQDPDLLRSQMDSCEVVVTKPSAINHTLEEIGATGNRGFWAYRIVRSNIELPLEGDTVLQQGDVLSLLGIEGPLRTAAREIGVIDAEVKETDLPTFSFGIVIGLLVGAINVIVGNVTITLGAAGGLLLSGIVVGYLRSLNPNIGRVPSAAQYVLQELGLLFFMASVGLRAGGQIVEALFSVGPVLFISGALITAATPLVSYFVGYYVLHLNPVILLGGICGAMTSTPALSVIIKKARSEVPALGYAGTYAFANILLTMAGGAIMRM